MALRLFGREQNLGMIGDFKVIGRDGELLWSGNLTNDEGKYDELDAYMTAIPLGSSPDPSASSITPESPARSSKPSQHPQRDQL